MSLPAASELRLAEAMLSIIEVSHDPARIIQAQNRVLIAQQRLLLERLTDNHGRGE